jgi:hypothetical protein
MRDNKRDNYAKSGNFDRGDAWIGANGNDLTKRPGERWCLVYTRNECEYRVASLLHSMRASFYLPLTANEHREAKVFLKGYLYCRANEKLLRHLKPHKWILNVTPALSEPHLLEYLKNINETLSAAFGAKILRKSVNVISAENKRHVFDLDEDVEIGTGLFSGSRGRIIEKRGKNGFVVQLTNFSKSLEVNVDYNDIVSLRPRSAEPKTKSDISKQEDERGVDATQVRALLEPVNEELIAYFAKNPDALYDLSPRKFEALVADVLADMGYDVTLTPSSKDGGRDVLAALNVPTGKILTIVECKRYSKERKIGVAAVERLLWVAEQYDRASCAMLATTSFFTKGAKKLERDYEWRLQLKDFDNLSEWLHKFGTWKENAHSGIWLPH